MTREEALQIFDLEKSATIFDIERRYTVLAQRARIEGQNAERDGRVNEAYLCLIGQEKKEALIPERLRKVILGKSLYEWGNRWHYMRWTILVFIIGSFFIGSVIYTIATNTKPDLQVAVIGRFAVLAEDIYSDDFPARTFMREQVDTIDPLLEFLPLKEEDTEEIDLSIRMQMSIILAGANPMDMFIANEYTFSYYSVSGIYRTIEPLYEQLRSTLDPSVFSRIVPRYGTVEDSDGNLVGEPYMMGLDVTGMWLVEGLGLNSDRNILCLGSVSEYPEKAEALILAIFREHEQLAAEGKAMYKKKQQELGGTTATPTAVLPTATTAR